MALREDNHAEAHKVPPDILDYRTPRREERRPRISGVFAGVLAFVAVLFQYPWSTYMGCLAVEGDPFLSRAGWSRHVVLVILSITWPSLVAMALALLSIRRAGVSVRNSFGVLALLGVLATVESWYLQGSLFATL